MFVASMHRMRVHATEHSFTDRHQPVRQCSTAEIRPNLSSSSAGLPVSPRPRPIRAAHEFRLDRGGAKHHVTFGKGAHFCVGAALARLEARIVLSTLLERTTWTEAADTGRWLPSILVRRLEHLHLSTMDHG